MRAGSGAALALVLLMAASVARADLPKRELPDYDGRPDTTSVGEALLWVPRVILSPLYLVSEFVLRRPLGFLIAGAERIGLPQALYDTFFFGPNHNAGILPIAFLDFGFYPSLGLYFFWNDFVPHQDLKLRGSLWGEHWLAGSISDRIHLDRVTDLVLSATAIRRPDYQFYGLGPNTLQGDLSRFGASRLDASVGLELKLGGLSRLMTQVGLRRVHFHHGSFSKDPSIEEDVRDGRYPLPPGFVSGFSALANQITLVIDTRHARPANGSGLRAELRAEQVNQLQPGDAGAFMRYGGTLGGYWDVASHGRVVSLSFAANFVDPLRSEAVIPFTELATIGGPESMRGFPAGRLYGRSAATATLRYRWPIWVWLDGSIQLAVGNVFEEHLQDFQPKLLRFSGALGIESVGEPNSSLEVLIGLGSETIEHGTQLTSLRFAIGTNHGF
jgi:Omp85 superfamily domain